MGKSTRRLVESAVMIAIGTVLSMFPFSAPWAFGGGVTICSMLPLVIIAHRYGTKWGLFTAFAASLLQMLMGLNSFSYVTSTRALIAVAVFDFLLAFMAMGLGGVFRKVISSQSGALAAGAVLACSAVCWVPAALLMDRWFPGSLNALGTAAVLQIANSMVLSRLNEYAPTHIFPAVLADALGCMLGGGLLICLQAALRSWLRGADLWSGSAELPGPLGDAPSLPFFGFLILGFLSFLSP